MSTLALRAPLVLVHGILGFDELRVGALRVPYFRGIPEALRARGNLVPQPPRLSPAGSVRERAADLKAYLLNNEEIAGRPVHLIAHSLGGLDARFMIANLEMAGHVLSLTMLGTPNHGTPIADLVVDALGPLQQLFQKATGISLQGFYDLTLRNAGEFAREQVPYLTPVNYYSIAARFSPGLLSLADVLKPTHDYMALKGMANDGMVPVASAAGAGPEPDEIWNGINHFRLVNWPSDLLQAYDPDAEKRIMELYGSVIDRLADEGF